LSTPLAGGIHHERVASGEAVTVEPGCEAPVNRTTTQQGDDRWVSPSCDRTTDVPLSADPLPEKPKPD
jgi:hypothetical protein